MTRPPQDAILGAIEQAGGKLKRAAALLGCSRASLYSWIYQYGLQDKVGLFTRAERDADILDRLGTLDTAECLASPDASLLDTLAVGHHTTNCVQPNRPGGPTLHLVSPEQTPQPQTIRRPRDPRAQRSVSLPDSLWLAVKHLSVDTGEPAGAIVERALREMFQREGQQ